MAAPSQFVGQTLGHYYIIEQIGAGGMGVVYRAHDEQLDRDVAIKVLPGGALANQASRRRFHQEALALARLNNPNIATVHEFSTQGSTDYLVTEYISGLSLDHKLAAGELSESEVVRVGVQLAQGLSAAHEQGVVHRDLKPANLRLTKDGRLKILDFGLAHLMTQTSENGLTATSTQPQGLTGTLPYMAPEQLRGEPAEVGSDIWSAGVVLYEMATARRPFEQKLPSALADDIIHKTPVPPRKLRPALSPGLEWVILRCLEKAPACRYQSARQLLSDLERLSVGVTPVAAGRRLWPVLTATAIAVLLAATASYYLLTKVQRAGSVLIPGRPSVAVLGFKNLSSRPEAAWLSTALSEMLSTELAVGERLRTIPGEDVARTKIDLSLPDTDSLGKDTLTRLRKNLNSDFVVLGSYLDLGKEAGGRIRLDLRMQDTKSGETLASVTESGNEAEVSDIVAKAGAQLRQTLGVGAVSAEDAGMVRASMPSSPEAARLYSEGLEKLRLFDALKARELLEKEIAAEPDFPLAHSALSAAWSVLGYDAKAVDEAKKAFDLSANLSREDRLLIEGRYRQATREWDKTTEIYRTLFAFFPDNLDHGLRLALAQDSAGRSSDALNTVAALRRLPAPTRDDPRIDLAETSAANSLADYKRGEAAANKAAQKGEAEGAWLLVARARLMECWASHRLGQFKQATAACQSARDIFGKAGDRNNMAWAQNNLGNIATDEGEYAAAQKMLEQALAVFREIGNKNYTAGALGNLADVLQYQGKLAASKKLHQQSLALYREIGSTDDAAIEMVNIASILLPEGDVEGARKMSAQALETSRRIGSKETVGLALINLSSALYAEGDLPAAKKNLDEGLRVAGEAGDKHLTSYFLAILGEISAAKADLVSAQKEDEQALAIRSELGEKVAIAESHLQLAELALESGQAVTAEKLAQQTAVELSGENSPEDTTGCQVLLARVFLAHGRLSEAQRAIEQARTLSQGTETRETRYLVAITGARVQAALGQVSDREQASRVLKAVIADAAKTRMLPREFDARLALGEIEMTSGKRASGQTRLASLKQEAAAKGFDLIARKAAAAAKGENLP